MSKVLLFIKLHFKNMNFAIVVAPFQLFQQFFSRPAEIYNKKHTEKMILSSLSYSGIMRT